MDQPVFLKPDQPARTVGHFLGVPLVITGWSWLPLSQALVWAVMTWILGRRYPGWSSARRLLGGFFSMFVMLGSEWTHNLAHAAAADRVGKPMDALRIFMGMPLVVFHPQSEVGVLPREHFLRALGGPVWSGLLLLVARVCQGFTRPGTLAREIADAAVGMNTFITLGGLTPIPGLDGGSMLKWGLVGRGYSLSQANQAVLRANRLAGVGLGAAAAAAFGRRKWLVGAGCAGLGALALAVGWGLFRDNRSPD